MAEHAIVGEAAADRELHGVDVVDPFADERALAEHVLVDVGDRARVRIDAGLATEQVRVARSRDARHARADARLQDRVAFGDPAAHGIELRPVERMRERAGERARGVARQAGVRVERDHVAHGGEALDGADHGREQPGRAAQRGVELLELAALALPAHPGALALVPLARAMEQVEAAVAGVLRFERGDRRGGMSHEPGVAGGDLALRVTEVGDEREAEVRIAIRTSSASTSASISAALVNIAGTATRVACAGGMPAEKSSRGSTLGATRSVVAQWTRLIARSDAHTVTSAHHAMLGAIGAR